MKLFELQEGRVRIQPEAYLIAEFADLLRRENVSPEEREQELAYVWFMCDYRSPYQNTPQEHRDDKVREELRIPRTWKADILVVAAMTRYLLLQETPAMQVLRETREGLLSTSSLMKVLRQRLEKIIADPKLETDDKIMDSATKTCERIMGLAIGIPKVVRELKTLEEEVKKELGQKTPKQRGGGSTGRYEG